MVQFIKKIETVIDLNLDPVMSGVKVSFVIPVHILNCIQKVLIQYVCQ